MIPATGLVIIFAKTDSRPAAPASLVGSWTLGQLWLFRLVPIVGAVTGGIVWNVEEEED